MVKLRTLVQTLVALGTNAYLLFPFGGSVIYQGPLKAVCHPGLNCYSCPGALLSCPVGAIQNFLASIRFYTPGTIPHVGAIVVAYLGFIGTLVGRLPCGWLCPFGFIQDLMHKIPARKFSVWEPLRWVKYAVLLVLVIILPLWLVDASTGLGHPWFCKLLCPAGTLEGALPMIFLKPSLWATLGFFFWNKLTILMHYHHPGHLHQPALLPHPLPPGGLLQPLFPHDPGAVGVHRRQLRGMRLLRPQVPHGGETAGAT